MRNSAIFDEIIRIFGTQKACAKALGISDKTFSRNLDRSTPKFIARLKKIGIVLPNKIEDKTSSTNEPDFIYQAKKIIQLEKELEKSKSALIENEKLKAEIAQIRIDFLLLKRLQEDKNNNKERR